MTAPDPADAAGFRKQLIDALDGPEPAGNPLHAAAVEAIIRDRLTRFHYSADDEQGARSAFAIDALHDASAVLAVIAPRIREDERERYNAELLGRRLERIEPDPEQPGYNVGVFDITAALAQGRQQAAADERERIRLLAIERKATYPVFGPGHAFGGYFDFADLIEAEQ